MTEPPAPPPYGVLIEAARKDARLSARVAARRTGISEGWWRQVVRGYQTLSGGAHGEVTGPAETVAAMAHTVGVTPEQLESEGERPDAAEALRHHEPGASTGAAPDSPGGIDWPIPPREGTPFTDLTLADAAEFAYEAYGRLRDLRRQGIERPAGAQVYPDDSTAAFGYDTAVAAGATPAQAIQHVATVQGDVEREHREQQDGRPGVRPALART